MVSTAARRLPDDEGLIDDLDDLPFDNRFATELPGDPDDRNVRRQVAAAAYSQVVPTPVARPTTLAVSPEVMADLGLSPALATTEDFGAVFAGNRLPRGAQPFAMNYGGHQFGNWAGQLGDGRAIATGRARPERPGVGRCRSGRTTARRDTRPPPARARGCRRT